jgi:hypothetical protein
MCHICTSSLSDTTSILSLPLGGAVASDAFQLRHLQTQAAHLVEELLRLSAGLASL